MTTVERSPGLAGTWTGADETQTQQAASSSSLSKGSPWDDVLDYLDAVFCDGQGYAVLFVGIGGHLSRTGRYDHQKRKESFFEFPAQRDDLAEVINSARDEDVYLCPYLMPQKKRSKHLDGIEMRLVHADCDGDVDLDKVRDLNGFAVASGTPGHAHVYVQLSTPVERLEHERLCRALGKYLGDADAKISASDVLRPPGTLNHKGRARGERSSVVEWLVRPTGVRWDPKELAVLLDADQVEVCELQRRECDSYGGCEPFDLSRYPKIKAALDKGSVRLDGQGNDRSLDTYRIVAAVKDAGLSIENAEWAVRQRSDLAERLDDRGDDDVLSCWDRVEEKDEGHRGGFTVPVTAQYQDAYIGEQITKDYLEGQFNHTQALGWMGFDGRRWKPVSDSIVYEKVREAVIDIHQRRAKSGGDSHELKLVSGLLSARRIADIQRIAKGILAVEVEKFDAHPDLLNVRNGVVDLRDGTLREHDPALMLTKVTMVNYVKGATHPDWEAALRAVPQDARVWLRDRFGQGITGHPTADDKMVMLRGGGENGKTTVIDGVRHALGDYAVTLPDRVLLGRNNDHPTELMTLRGARLALMEELPELGHLNVKRLKDLHGVGKMTARLCGKDSVSWTPTHTLFVTTNHLPRVDESDHGTWRRLVLLNFPYTFVKEVTEAERQLPIDPGLRDRIRTGTEQQEAILAWLVEGAVAWYRNDRQLPAEPDTVVKATTAWRMTSDVLLRYVQDRLELDPHRHVVSTELFGDFTDWLKSHGYTPWSDQTFSTRLAQHSEVGGQVEKKRVNNTKQTQSTVSRRPNIDGCKPLGPKYQAWVGLSFTTDKYHPDLVNEENWTYLDRGSSEVVRNGL